LPLLLESPLPDGYGRGDRQMSGDAEEAGRVKDRISHLEPNT